MRLFRAFLIGLAFAVVPLLANAQTPAVTKNGSVTIVTGATFQTVLASTSSRRSLTIQNNNTNTDNCWIQFGSGVTAANATAAKSIILAPGQAYTRYYPYIPLDEIEGTCTNTSDSLYVDTQ